MKGRDYGVAGNLILGLIGSLVGGWVLALLGYNAPSDLLRHAAVSLLGAMFVLGVARRLKPVSAQEPQSAREGGGAHRRRSAVPQTGRSRAQRVGETPQARRQATQPECRVRGADDVRQRVADRVATFGGSWTFIGIFLLAMLIWTTSYQHHHPQALRSLPVHSAQPVPLVPRCNAGTRHHDEPEPPGRQRPAHGEQRLRSEPAY